MVKKIIFLLFLFTFLFITDVNASTIGGQEADSPLYAVVSSNYNNVPVRIWTENIFGTDIVDYGTVVNDYVYITACSDMPTLGYSYVPFYNNTTGNSASATAIRYAANLTSKTCTFNTGVQGKVVYIKFRLISDLLNVPVSGNNTWLYNDYITLYIGTNRVFSFSIQNIIALDDDIDIYSNDFDVTLLQQQNQQIINNQNNNTNSIINNQNSNTNTITQNQDDNTQDIIDSQNQNTQDEIINDQVCSDIPVSKYVNIGSLSANGSSNTSSDFRHTDYIPISKYDSLKLISKVSTGNSFLCFYTDTKTTISCISQQSLAVNNVITIPDNASYFRATLTLRDNPPRPVWEYCRNGNQALDDSINNLNDSITSTDTPNTNQDIQDMDDMVASDTPISDLITMPLTLINAYINGIGSTCSPVNLGSLLGTNLSIPCINLEQRLGSNLWNNIDTICCIFLCYEIAMLFISAFDGITSLRDDFEGLYQPKHAYTGYVPKHGGGN